jgi:uncharacterized protein (TIGR02391 family)
MSALPNKYFKQARDIQIEINKFGMGSKPQYTHKAFPSWLDKYDELITYEPLIKASRDLFKNKHYTQAVEQSFKCLNNLVKQKSGLKTLDGDSLMRRAFSADNPVLKINSFKTKSDKDEQKGYMDIYAGVISGIRNPRAHEHILQDTPEVAIEMLVLSNHLARILDKTKKCRVKHANKKPEP